MIDNAFLSLDAPAGSSERSAALAALVAEQSAAGDVATSPTALAVPVTQTGREVDLSGGKKRGVTKAIVRCHTYARQFIVEDEMTPGRKQAVTEIARVGDTVTVPKDPKTERDLAAGYLVTSAELVAEADELERVAVEAETAAEQARAGAEQAKAAAAKA